MADLLPDPDWIEHFRKEIEVQPALAKLGYGLGYMAGWTRGAARAHADECGLGGCKTCVNFVRALSLFSAYDLQFPPDAGDMEKLYGS